MDDRHLKGSSAAEDHGQRPKNRDLLDYFVGYSPTDVSHYEGVAQLETEKVRRVDSSVETGQDQCRQAGPDGQAPLVKATGELEVAIDKGLQIRHGRSSLEP
jgi:hypothetical protein